MLSCNIQQIGPAQAVAGFQYGAAPVVAPAHYAPAQLQYAHAAPVALTQKVTHHQVPVQVQGVQDGWSIVNCSFCSFI